MRYVLDTNVLLDFFIDRDEKRHLDCVRLIGAVKRGNVKAVVLSVVVAELAWVMGTVYKVERWEIAKTLRSLTQIKKTRVIEVFNWGEVFEDYRDKKVKFVDAMIANLKQVKNNKWVVVSYDKEFDKLEVKRLEPGQV